MASEGALGTLAKSDGRETKHRGAHTRGLSQAWGHISLLLTFHGRSFLPTRLSLTARLARKWNSTVYTEIWGGGGNRFW